MAEPCTAARPPILTRRALTRTRTPRRSWPQLAATQTPKQGTRLKSFGSAERYLSGVLWTIAMYTDGHVPDFTFLFTNLNAPADARRYDDLMHMTSMHMTTNAAPSSRARPQCRRRPLCRSPHRLSVRHYCPSRACASSRSTASHAVEPGGSLAFSSTSRRRRLKPHLRPGQNRERPAQPRASSPSSSKSTKPVRPVPNSTRPSPSSSKSTSPPPSSTNSTKLPPLDYDGRARRRLARRARLTLAAALTATRLATLHLDARVGAW